MGKSTKKSTPRVDAAHAVAPPTKPTKKAKREVEEVIEKQVTKKKQKRDGSVEQAVEKQKSETKTQKKITKIEESSSSEEATASQSKEEQVIKVPAKKGGPVAKLPVKESSSDDSSSSDEERKPVVPSKKQPSLASKNGSVGKHAGKAKSSSSEDDSDSSDDEDTKSKVAVPSKKVPVAAAKNGAVASSKKKDESSDDSDWDDSDSSVDDKNAKETSQPKKLGAAVKNESVAVTKKIEEAGGSLEEESSSEEGDSDEEYADATKAVPLERPPSTTVTKQPSGAQNAVKPNSKDAQKESSDSDESSDDEPSKSQSVKKPTQESKKTNSSDEGSSEEDGEDSSDEEEKQPSKMPKKNDTDIEMIDAPSAKQEGSLSGKKMPQTPAAPQVGTGSKTLFMGNLSFSVEERDVKELFKDAGEIVEIRFSMRDDVFKGYGHIEFATEEAAQKALKLDGEMLLSRPVKLDFARERGSYTPASGNENSYQRGGRTQGQTVYVRGFDSNDGEDKIRSKLEEHFGTCGEISRVSIPKDFVSGGVKGFAYVDFADSDGFNKALELSGCELGESTLTVEAAKPRGDSRDGGGRGRGGRGWSGDDRFGVRGRGGRFGGRDSGGRFGGRDSGGRFGSGRGGGGRGTPNKPSMATSGKKTFGDD